MFDDLTHNSRQLATADVASNNVANRVDYDFAFTSITGCSGYDSDDQRDVDWTPTNFLYELICGVRIRSDVRACGV